MITLRWVGTADQSITLPSPAAFDALLQGKSTHSYTVDLRQADKSTIARINLQYRQLDQPTDVLSFPLYPSIADLPDNDAPLGDIVICPAMMDKEHLGAAEIVVHGVLHLLGFDHETDPHNWEIATNLVKDESLNK